MGMRVVTDGARLYAPIIERDRYNAAMLQVLQLHPDSICTAVTRIEVRLTRPTDTTLALRYAIIGNMAELAFPTETAPNRTDELWQHTCCEAFIGTMDDTLYYEFNFSPSTQWAAYRFTDYRKGMSVATEISSPQITVRSNASRFELEALIDCTPLLLSSSACWRMGLSVIIEEKNDRKSYWALAHAPGKPDFHHQKEFVIELEK